MRSIQGALLVALAGLAWTSIYYVLGDDFHRGMFIFASLAALAFTNR